VRRDRLTWPQGTNLPRDLIADRENEI